MTKCPHEYSEREASIYVDELCPTCLARWAIAYSHSPRAKKWYRVSRMVYADSGWFELYWHADLNLRSDDQLDLRVKAREHGLDLMPGLFCDMHSPARRGGEMEHKL